MPKPESGNFSEHDITKEELAEKAGDAPKEAERELVWDEVYTEFDKPIYQVSTITGPANIYDNSTYAKVDFLTDGYEGFYVEASQSIWNKGKAELRIHVGNKENKREKPEYDENGKGLKKGKNQVVDNFQKYLDETPQRIQNKNYLGASWLSISKDGTINITDDPIFGKNLSGKAREVAIEKIRHHIEHKQFWEEFDKIKGELSKKERNERVNNFYKMQHDKIHSIIKGNE